MQLEIRLMRLSAPREGRLSRCLDDLADVMRETGIFIAEHPDSRKLLPEPLPRGHQREVSIVIVPLSEQILIKREGRVEQSDKPGHHEVDRVCEVPTGEGFVASIHI